MPTGTVFPLRSLFLLLALFFGSLSGIEARAVPRTEQETSIQNRHYSSAGAGKTYKASSPQRLQDRGIWSATGMAVGVFLLFLGLMILGIILKIKGLWIPALILASLAFLFILAFIIFMIAFISGYSC